MSHINDLVERHQSDARPTLVVTDEGHIITTNPLLARYVVKITKMWRKLGAWFWIATQNLEDFPDASRKMLNMMEWWLCLVMPKEEVEQIARSKDLSEEQRSLLLSARKEPGKYVEGVVLADNLEALFRSVPPPLSLALARPRSTRRPSGRPSCAKGVAASWRPFIKWRSELPIAVARSRGISAGFPIFGLSLSLYYIFISRHGGRRDGLQGGNTSYGRLSAEKSAGQSALSVCSSAL
jgi:hypothetical protein